MRILAVIARQTAKSLITPSDMSVDIIVPRRGRLRREIQAPLLGPAFLTDDVVVIRQLLRLKLIPINIPINIPDIDHEPIPFDVTTIHTLIAEYDCPRILQHQIGLGVKIETSMSRLATSCGSTCVLQCLEECDQPIDEDLCGIAAYWNLPETLDWLRKRGYSWGADVVMEAVGNNAINALEYLWRNGCPWPEEAKAATYAIKNDNRDALVWQMINKCPMPNDLCVMVGEYFCGVEAMRLYTVAQNARCCTCEGGLHW